MQVGRDACRLERLGLRRPAAGDERERRAEPCHDLELLLAELGGDEAEDADAPRAVAEPLRVWSSRRSISARMHQGERQEGQAAAFGHRVGEGGDVADAGHGPLGDRVRTPCSRARGPPGPSGRSVRARRTSRTAPS